MNEMVVKGTKLVVNVCVNRTVSDALDVATRNYGDSRFTRVVKFIGREGLSACITACTYKVINEEIDKAADAIAELIVNIKRPKE